MKYIFFHDNCVDGFCAAFVAWLGLGRPKETDVKFIPATHGRDLPPIKDKSEVLFFDFCPKIDVLKNLISSGHNVQIYDHHENAVSDVIKNGFHVEHDFNKSGARIVYDHFFNFDVGYFKPEYRWVFNLFDLVDYVQDQDLYTWKIENSKEFMSVVNSLPLNFECWDAFLLRMSNDEYYNEIILEGKKRMEINREKINEIKKRAFPFTFIQPKTKEKHNVYIVNSQIMQSVICSELCKDRNVKFACAFYFLDNKNVKWSIRSVDFPIDDICREFGGNGHKHAGGFVQSIDQFYQMMAELKNV